MAQITPHPIACKSFSAYQVHAPSGQALMVVMFCAVTDRTYFMLSKFVNDVTASGNTSLEKFLVEKAMEEAMETPMRFILQIKDQRGLAAYVANIVTVDAPADHIESATAFAQTIKEGGEF